MPSWFLPGQGLVAPAPRSKPQLSRSLTASASPTCRLIGAASCGYRASLVLERRLRPNGDPSLVFREVFVVCLGESFARQPKRIAAAIQSRRTFCETNPILFGCAEANHVSRWEAAGLLSRTRDGRRNVICQSIPLASLVRRLHDEPLSGNK